MSVSAPTAAGQESRDGRYVLELNGLTFCFHIVHSVMRTIIIGIAIAILSACSDSEPEMETAVAVGDEYIEDTVESPEIPCRSDDPWAEYRIPQYEPKRQKSLAEEHYDDMAERALRQDALKRKKYEGKQVAKPVAKPCPELNNPTETAKPPALHKPFETVEQVDERYRRLRQTDTEARIRALEARNREADATQGQR